MPEHRLLITNWTALLTAIADDKVATLGGLTAGDRVDVAKQKFLVQMLSTAISLRDKLTNSFRASFKKYRNKLGLPSDNISREVSR